MVAVKLKQNSFRYCSYVSQYLIKDISNLQLCRKAELRKN